MGRDVGSGRALRTPRVRRCRDVQRRARERLLLPRLGVQQPRRERGSGRSGVQGLGQTGAGVWGAGVPGLGLARVLAWWGPWRVNGVLVKTCPRGLVHSYVPSGSRR
jgi:hypothetical protein